LQALPQVQHIARLVHHALGEVLAHLLLAGRF
jgi:hypothetical protein